MQTKSVDCEAIAQQLMRAWRDRATVEAPSRTAPQLTQADARAIAERLRELRITAGDRPAGYKVGFTNPAVRAQFDADGQMAATVYVETIAATSTVDASGLLGPRIEPEVVLGIGHDGVAWAALGFEIVQSHVKDWAFGWNDAIADFGLHAMLLVGERRPFSTQSAARLSSMRVRLLRDNEVVELGCAADVEGGPVGSLTWLREDLARVGRDVRAGELVSTGSMTRVPPIAASQRWTIEADDSKLPALTIEVT
ncbi:MAG: 2-keto-4-pentenoate hydratase [Vulcanimicrobiaceae bacterium]